MASWFGIPPSSFAATKLLAGGSRANAAVSASGTGRGGSGGGRGGSRGGRGGKVPSKHDITVFRGGDADQKEEDRDQSALYFKVEDDERLIGDAGYSGEPTKVVVTRDEQSSEFKEFLARAKNRQETFHWRLKSFNILGHRFRHGVNTKERMRMHRMAVELVAGIVQYDYENGHPPFDIC